MTTSEKEHSPVAKIMDELERQTTKKKKKLSITFEKTQLKYWYSF